LTHYDTSSFSHLTDLFYEGSEDDWNKIEIQNASGSLTPDEREQYLQNINIHYNCSQPEYSDTLSFAPSMEAIDQRRFLDKKDCYFNEELWM
jgi:hypothetical protein